MKQAMIFPGQGSQSVGMLGDLANDHRVRQLCAKASEKLGYDIYELIQEDPHHQLNQTAFTQPALLVASVSFYNHWLARGRAAPLVMAGHSLGEWSALVCAGAVHFDTAVSLVQKRGELMQAAGDRRPGAMAAILSLANEVVSQLCAEAEGGVVSPANFNSQGQVVVSGDEKAVDYVIAHAKASGAKLAKKLAVSVASHSPLMAEAARDFRACLNDVEFAPPQIPVIHNFDVQTHVDSSSLREVLVEQLVSPVRWVECMGRLSQYGVQSAVECGPGNVLTGLARRMEPSMPTQSFFDALGD
jgi:[acyl-carrier-protein] S-malonyltransferase